ncbi:winged helix-turn-helix domain-containing protein [Curtanaerobium respiraculi]|uniref:winged helix-turn-helix domain-containing protein n=1 Tax=Curtanaerobium respiraculi TaxID=2949669 RepID=UPI0024B3B0F5|nr:LysR family transcriptional regulator [Curtanaerobium respiraculi]
MQLDKLTPSVKISIHNPEDSRNAAFGPGVAALCRGVRDKGSLNAAAKGMHMAYSKAWRIIKDTEAALGFQMLNRDGAHGSTLTVEADRLLTAYDKLCVSLSLAAKTDFSELLR